MFIQPANGMMVGSHCEYTCDKRLRHVFCNPRSNKCECEKNYPVSIGKTIIFSILLSSEL